MEPREKKRPVFQALLAKMQPGDTLYVHSIDRLGIDVKETVRVWKELTRQRQANIVVLNDPALNTAKNGPLSLAQVRRAAQQAFDGAAGQAGDGGPLYAAFELVTPVPEKDR